MVVRQKDPDSTHGRPVSGDCALQLVSHLLPIHCGYRKRWPQINRFSGVEKGGDLVPWYVARQYLGVMRHGWAIAYSPR
jgi:hypothetical protein